MEQKIHTSEVLARITLLCLRESLVFLQKGERVIE